MKKLKRIAKDFLGRDKEGALSRRAWLRIRAGKPCSDQSNVLVSLTTHGVRVNRVHVVIEAILDQSVRPAGICLNLNREAFGKARLPRPLKNLLSHGVELQFCQTDQPHDKLLPSLRSNPNKVIVTVDDDVLYDPRCLERLLETSARHREAIVCDRGRQIQFLDNQTPAPYSEWRRIKPPAMTCSHSILQTGVGGVLYPPKSLHPDVFDQTLIDKLSPFADDLWFKVMALRKGTPVAVTPNGARIGAYVSGSSAQKLEDKNVFGGENDRQFSRLIQHFGLTREHFIDLVTSEGGGSVRTTCSSSRLQGGSSGSGS